MLAALNNNEDLVKLFISFATKAKCLREVLTAQNNNRDNVLTAFIASYDRWINSRYEEDRDHFRDPLHEDAALQIISIILKWAGAAGCLKEVLTAKNNQDYNAIRLINTTEGSREKFTPLIIKYAEAAGVLVSDIS
ncbi:MAG TPA: hypothetical protein PKD37_03370 [Oligoflexia bacterium]|nr:hypothetical protein [Oligoflexia bacterium]HMP27009.1 hypothetical protein [Oligoflexia bacterium]